VTLTPTSYLDWLNPGRRGTQRAPPIFRPPLAAANPVLLRAPIPAAPEAAARAGTKGVGKRNLEGPAPAGRPSSAEEVALNPRMQTYQQACPRGAWLLDRWHALDSAAAQTSSGAYKTAASTNLIDWEAFGLMMDLGDDGLRHRRHLRTRLIERCRCCATAGDRERQPRSVSRPAASARRPTRFQQRGQPGDESKVGDTRRGWGGQLTSVLLELRQRHQLQRRCCDHGEQRGFSPIVRTSGRNAQRASGGMAKPGETGRSLAAGWPQILKQGEWPPATSWSAAC